MKKLIFFSLCISFGFISQAQPLYLHWTRFIGGQFPDGAAHSISGVDSSVVFVGYTCDTLGNYDVPASLPDSQIDLPVNLLVSKMDSNRQLAWVRVYGGSRSDRAYKILQLNDGSYAVLGITASHDGDISWTRGGNDIWLLKLDNQGELLWEKTYGSSAGDLSFSFISTSDKGFLVLAASNGSDFDAPFHYGSALDLDWLVIKVDSSGNLQWSKTLGGSGQEGRTGSIFEADYGYFLISNSSSSDNDCNDSVWHTMAHNDMDYYTLKLDTAGNVLWSKSYGGSKDDYVSHAMWDERDSSIVITGFTKSIDHMVQNNYGSFYRSIWVIKTDKDGNYIWGSRMGDTITDNDAGNIMPYKNGGYIMSAAAYNAFQLQPGHIGSLDSWIFMLDSLGHPYYDKIIGGTSQEVPTAPLIDFRSGYALTGTTFSYTFSEGANLDHNHSLIATEISVSALFEYPDPLTISENHLSRTELKVYPNPAKNIVNIVLPKDDRKNNGVLIVSDINGKVVYSKYHKSTTELSVETSGWVKGIYMVLWTASDGRKYQAKLINN